MDEFEKQRPSRKQKSLGLLCQKFLARYPSYPLSTEKTTISLDEVAVSLGMYHQITWRPVSSYSGKLVSLGRLKVEVVWVPQLGEDRGIGRASFVIVKFVFIIHRISGSLQDQMRMQSLLTLKYIFIMSNIFIIEFHYKLVSHILNSSYFRQMQNYLEIACFLFLIMLPGVQNWCDFNFVKQDLRARALCLKPYTMIGTASGSN